MLFDNLCVADYLQAAHMCESILIYDIIDAMVPYIYIDINKYILQRIESLLNMLAFSSSMCSTTSYKNRR